MIEVGVPPEKLEWIAGPFGTYAQWDDDNVIIRRSDFDELVEDAKHLADLYARGVDNWEGF